MSRIPLLPLTALSKTELLLSDQGRANAMAALRAVVTDFGPEEEVTWLSWRKPHQIFAYLPPGKGEESPRRFHVYFDPGTDEVRETHHCYARVRPAE